MYFRDLDLCRYFGGPMYADNWNVPLRAIGWLEHPHPFDQGKLPGPVHAKLRHSMEMACASNCYIGFMGLHECSLCAAHGERRVELDLSAINIFLPGEACVYVFSACIRHYIERHSYHPPLVFCEAVETSQSLVPSQYRSALIRVNGGPIPLSGEDRDPPRFGLFARDDGDA